jgi:hypothetical protein
LSRKHLARFWFTMKQVYSEPRRFVSRSTPRRGAFIER